MKDIWKNQFQQNLLYWYSRQQRVLPWRESRDPYAIWVSEIMLQQTRVEAVMPYFTRFLQAFPTVEVLAEAELEEVLKLWEGLGYYSRARNLHKAAKWVVEECGGQVPATLAEIRKLPGVGAYTAGAVLSIAFNQSYPAVDGNVKRVFSRIYAIPDDVKKAEVKARIEELARDLIPDGAASDFNQALMELGALVCIPASPRCKICPVKELCVGYAEGEPVRYPVKGETRQPRALVRLTAVVCRETGEGERILLMQNPLEGMLAGLWGFPGIELTPEKWQQTGVRQNLSDRSSRAQPDLFQETTDNPEVWEKMKNQLINYLAEDLGVEITVGALMGVTEYTFTHRKWTMPLIKCRFVGAKSQSSVNVAWVTPEEFADYAIPTVYQRVIREVWK